MAKTKIRYAEYKLIDYYDVWGNEDNGWEVNNLCDVTETYGTITISDDACDEEIIDFLIQINYLAPEVKKNFEVSGDDMMIEISLDNGYPLCRLEKIRDI